MTRAREKKPYKYYSFNFSGPPGHEGYPAHKVLKKARLCSVHDYGMIGGDLFRLVRSTRDYGEILRIVRSKKIPADVHEVSPESRTIRDRSVAKEFTRSRIKQAW